MELLSRARLAIRTVTDEEQVWPSLRCSPAPRHAAFGTRPRRRVERFFSTPTPADVDELDEPRLVFDTEASSRTRRLLWCSGVESLQVSTQRSRMRSFRLRSPRSCSCLCDELGGHDDFVDRVIEAESSYFQVSASRLMSLRVVLDVLREARVVGRRTFRAEATLAARRPAEPDRDPGVLICIFVNPVSFEILEHLEERREAQLAGPW